MARDIITWDGLSDRERFVFHARFVEKHTYEQIGSDLGVTGGRARQILMKGQRYFKRLQAASKRAPECLSEQAWSDLHDYTDYITEMKQK